VAEAPLVKLARIIGGVALGHGALGHQVLGQLVTLNAKEVELAAAATLIAAASRQPNAGIYAAVRILAPALAVHLITRREIERMDQAWQRLDEKEARLALREASLDPRTAVRGAP
jgi:hypothetical protein